MTMSVPASHFPTITIVTPSFNQGKYIERTIQSVLRQNYPDLEYIVIDGGSTDETLSILKRYEGRLRWTSEKDSGQSEAINKGFRLAKGEIVAWLNSDDTYLPGALEKVGRYFAAYPDVMMVYGEGYMIDENDAIKSRFPFTEPKFDLWKLIYFGDYILQQSTFFRQSIFDSIEMLGESLHYTMDWDLFIRIGKRFRVDYIPEYFGCIREHGEAKTSTGGSKRFEEIKGIVRKHGVMRYPLAFFNYAWDTYGKGWFADGSIRHQGWLKSKTFSLSRCVLEVLFAYYQKRLQQGYYADGWVGREAMLVVPNADPRRKRRTLRIAGEIYQANVPLKIRITVNRRYRTKCSLSTSGHFDVRFELPAILGDADCYHVRLKIGNTFNPRRLGIGTDERDLGFLLEKLEALD